MKTEKKGIMRCPVDGESLLMSERAGIEIDYCPSCRGVERSAQDSGGVHRQISRHEDARHPMLGSGRHGSGGYGDSPPKRRRSFLEDLFD